MINMTALEVGARYSSFEDFQAALAKYSRETNSIYTVFNSKSIEAENRGRIPDKQFPASLKYRFIKYTCKHYGSNRSKSRGLRPNQSSFKIGCPAFIYLSAQKNVLVVEKMETNHSHECDPDVINFYPERRNISERAKVISLINTVEGENDLIKSVREDVKDLLRLHVDRRRIRNYVRLRTNRVLTAVDLSNLAKQIKDKEISEERSYQLLDMLTSLESKENEPARLLEDLVKKEKYKALKRKIAHVKAECLTPGIESGNERDSVQEHGYSNQNPETPLTPQKWWKTSKDQDSPSPLASKRGKKLESQGIEWNSRALEDMVKSINPNEDGPVLVHMNNYDGVMVVEIQNGQGSVTQLEGTVVEVEDDLQGDDSRLVVLEEPCLEQPSGVTNGEPSSAPIKSPRKLQTPLGKTKKIIQFRKRENASMTSETSTENIGLKNLIDIAMETAQCSPKEEEIEILSSNDPMDNGSDAGFDDTPAIVDCTSVGDMSRDADERYSGPVLKYTEKERLEAETEMLRVKTNKLKLQVEYLKNELSKQDLEKEKLRLEIVLLKARIGVSDLH